jgi:hypothetical protein
MRVRLLLLVALVLPFAVTAAPAATPSSGTIGSANPIVSWEGQAYTAASVDGPGSCPAVDPANETCDHFQLTVGEASTYWDTHDGGARVRIEWLSPTEDFDLYVYDSAGNEVGHSTSGASNFEEVFVPDASGTYDVLVIPFLVSASGYSGTAAFESEVSGTSSGPGPYYFHGDPTDDAGKALGGTAFFDTDEPTDLVPGSQTTTEVANQDFAKNPLAAFWTGDFTGQLDGSLEIHWFWSSGGGSVLGATVAVTVFADPPAAGGEVPPEQIIGRRQVTLTVGPTPLENVSVIPVQGTVLNEMTIQVALISSGSEDIRVFYDTPDLPSRFLVTSVPVPVLNPVPEGVEGLASAATQGLQFTASVPADQQRDESEPLVETNKDGAFFTCGPTGFSNAADYAQVSTDGGDQFHLLGTPPRGQQGAGGGGDCGLAHGLTRNSLGNYQYSYSGLGALTGFVTATSANNGHNLVTGGPFANGVTDEGGGADRQWQTFIDDHTVLLIYNQQVPRNVVVQRSTDGGLTYGPISAIGAPSARFPGPIRYDEAHGIAFFAWDSFENHINLSMSRDGGETWTHCLAATAPDETAGFVTADADGAGNIYIAFALKGSYHTYMTSLAAEKVAKCDEPVVLNGPQPTKDPGFSAPVQVDRNEVRTTVFPWLAAGGQSGRVAVTFYGTDQDGDPNTGLFKAAWYVYVNQSLNALDPAATFSQVKAITHPFHVDSICLNGLGCDLAVPPGDRSLADFFAIDYNPVSGRLGVVFNRANKKPDEAVGHVANPVFVTQASGPSNGGGTVFSSRSVVRTHSDDPRGDALSSYSILGTPTPPPPTTNEPAADFISVDVGPEIDLHTGIAIANGGFTVTMTLADLSTAALTQTMTRTGSQSLLWLFRFTNGYQDVGAAARYNPVQGFTFGYNDYTTSSTTCGPPSSGEKCVVYPGSTPIQGQADQASGTIQFSVPRYVLRALGAPDSFGRPTEIPAAAGSRFYDATAFSLGNNASPVQDVQSYLYPLDNAPAMDFLLGAGTTGGGGGGAIKGCQVNGGGSILGTGGQAKFTVDAHANGKGSVAYRDPGGGVDFRSKGTVTLNCTANSAELRGTGVNNRNETVTFTVKVVDNGEAGTTDTFTITLSNGYSRTGTLLEGNIQVKQK